MKAFDKSSLLSSSVLIGLMAAGAAHAQDPAEQTEPAETQQPAAATETIQVTGTRIQSPGVVANSPITSVGEEEFEFRQPVAVEELVRTLPAASPAIGPGTNNGSGGGATIDLRGLGSNRSLVIMDGRRIVPFNLAGSVDTNVIPLALIDRVDLVTGGAASVYGSDAIAGVVNFILKDDFEGVELRGQYGTSEQGDADRRRVELTMGGNFDGGRGNAVFSIGYTDTDPVRQDARDIGLESLSSATGAPSGSATAVPAFFNTPANDDGDPLGSLQLDPSTGELVEDGAGSYNFNPDNYYQGPLERYQAVAKGNYEINRFAEVYADMLYVRSDVGTQLAPSGTFGGTFETAIGNPLIPEPMRQTLCDNRGIAPGDCSAGNDTPIDLSVNRRFTELGPRLNDFENTTFQYTAGIRGDLWEGWSYDAYYQYGESDQTQTRGNWGSLSRVTQALNVDGDGNCVDDSLGCVPLNVYGEEGTITEDQLDFINLSTLLRQSVEQEVLTGSVNGDLFGVASPFAVDGISTAFGYEYRRIQAGTISDQASQLQGEVLGTGAPTPDREGTFQLYEFFGEAYVPLIQDKTFFQNLSLELGARNTEFKSGGQSDNYWTYKAGGEWQPVDDLRFRGLYQRATRAPNINELFAPQVTGLSNLDTDPCAGTIGDAALEGLCVQTGVPQGAIGNLGQPSAGQVNVLSGGNPELGPEVADTYTAGFVYQPSFAPSLNISLDYYLIEIEDAISSQSVTDVIDGCYSTEFNPDREFNAQCELIGRSPSSGDLNANDAAGIGLALNNIGQIKRDGVDLNVSYGFDVADMGFDPSLGSVALSFNANLANDTKGQPTPTSVNRQCTNYYSVACGAPMPDLKITSRATWNVSDFDVSVQWRHLGSVIEEPGGADFLEDFSRIPAYNYFDLSAGWNFNDAIRFTGTVANLTDEQPPNVGNTIGSTTTNSGNTFPQTYDVIGRYYTIGARMRF